MGLRRNSKKKNNKSSDYVGFRAKDDRQREDFYNRADALKEKGISKADIFKAGLLALEDGRTLEQGRRKQRKAINERDYYLKKAIEINQQVEAFNKQFKFIHNLEDTDLKNHVLTIKILDKNGREYEP